MSKVQIFEIPELFTEVQMKRVFPDGKTFVDCMPKDDLEEIAREIQSAKSETRFQH